MLPRYLELRSRRTFGSAEDPESANVGAKRHPELELTAVFQRLDGGFFAKGADGIRQRDVEEVVFVYSLGRIISIVAEGHLGTSDIAAGASVSPDGNFDSMRFDATRHDFLKEMRPTYGFDSGHILKDPVDEQSQWTNRSHSVVQRPVDVRFSTLPFPREMILHCFWFRSLSELPFPDPGENFFEVTAIFPQESLPGSSADFEFVSKFSCPMPANISGSPDLHMGLTFDDRAAGAEHLISSKNELGQIRLLPNAHKRFTLIQKNPAWHTVYPARVPKRGGFNLTFDGAHFPHAHEVAALNAKCIIKKAPKQNLQQVTLPTHVEFAEAETRVVH